MHKMTAMIHALPRGVSIPLARLGALIAIVAGLGLAPSAFARIKCDVQTSGTLARLPSLNISADTPIGTVLWSASGVTITADCGKASVTGKAEDAWFYRKDMSLGNGLSLYLTYKGDRGNTAKGFNTGTSVSNYYVPTIDGTLVRAIVDLELVKTGATQTSGTIATDLQAVASIASAAPDQTTDPANFFVAGLSNVSFQANTCSVRNSSIAVDLGQVAANRASGFGSAVGTTSADKAFNIDLTCNTVTAGTFGVYMQLGGTAVTNYANQGVLALSAVSGAADGLGIQVLKGDASSRTAVTFNTPWKIGAFPMATTNLSVPFIAHYYQTATTVKPGIANGSATFTVTYQ